MNQTTEPQSEDITVPPNALINCPKVSFRFARVLGCVGCDAFSGLEDRFPGSKVPFSSRYLVKCAAEPVRRELKELAE